MRRHYRRTRRQPSAVSRAFLPIRQWLLDRLIGDIPVAANIFVQGGVELEGDYGLVRKVTADVRGPSSDPDCYYDWFIPQRPAHAGVTVRNSRGFKITDSSVSGFDYGLRLTNCGHNR